MRDMTGIDETIIDSLTDTHRIARTARARVWSESWPGAVRARRVVGKGATSCIRCWEFIESAGPSAMPSDYHGRCRDGARVAMCKHFRRLEGQGPESQTVVSNPRVATWRGHRQGRGTWVARSASDAAAKMLGSQAYEPRCVQLD